MIDLLSEEQVQAFIEQRKQMFGFDDSFHVITPLNHAFLFWSDGDVSISILDPFDNYLIHDYQPEIAKLYGAEYGSNSGSLRFITDPATRKHLYELFINDPECFFFHNSNVLEQELQTRGLIENN